jgi:superfamily I DNA/RNA helicase
VRGRSRTLRVNYRTTDEIRKWAVAALAGKPVDDLDGERADERGYRSLFHGAPPTVKVFPSEREELDYLVETLRERLKIDPPQSICVVARTRPQLKDLYIPAMEDARIAALLLDGRNSDADAESIRVATMHRVKGLEFQSMIIVGASAAFLPLPAAVNVGDDVEVAEEAIMRERSLLYVAASRGRDFLTVTASGELSPLIEAPKG